MTLEQVIANLDDIENGIEEEAKRLINAYAVSALSEVKNRSIERGIFINGNEGQTARYSQKKVPTWFFQQRTLNEGGRAFIKQNVYETYEAFKKASGITNANGNINLSYSNRFWSSVRVVDKGSLRVAIETGEAGDNPTEKYEKDYAAADVSKYAQYLGQKYGAFLMPTEQEQITFAEDAQKEFANWFTRKLFK